MVYLSTVLGGILINRHLSHQTLISTTKECPDVVVFLDDLVGTLCEHLVLSHDPVTLSEESVHCLKLLYKHLVLLHQVVHLLLKLHILFSLCSLRTKRGVFPVVVVFLALEVTALLLFLTACHSSRL